MIAPAVALAVVAFIAGHPAQIACDVSESATAVEAWTTPGGSTTHFKPSLCEGLGSRPGDLRFGRALGTLIHEGAHARGVKSEACAESWADLAVFDVLRRFYNIPMFSPLSWRIGAQVYAQTQGRPAEYQPSGQSCAAEPH